MTSSARCGKGETPSKADKLANVSLFIHFTCEAASNVPASEEDIVSLFLHTVEGRPTPELNFVQKTNAFESPYVIVLCRMTGQSVG